MSSDHPHIDPTSGIEDVELEDEQFDDKSMEELVKARVESEHEAVEAFRQAAGTEENAETVEKTDSEGSSGETVEFGPAKTDGDIIKRTGIARLGVDLEDEDDEAMRDLIKEARDGDVEVGLREESSGDEVLDAISKGTQGVRERFERDVPMSELPPGQQATTLAKEAAEDLDVETIIEDAADLPKSPSAVREQVFEKVYGDITKFVRTIYSEEEIDTTVLKTVREKIATDAARRAMVHRKAAEDGVTTESEGYNPEDEAPTNVEEETQEEASDGDLTDAPDTEGESHDVDLSDEDMDLEA